MRTVQRDIVGAYIFSNDGYLLLGKNGPGGVYPDCWIVPAGGVEAGESKLQTAQREIMEELGIDITPGNPRLIDYPQAGTSTKTLESGETVQVEMTFFSFLVNLPLPATQIPFKLNGDLAAAEWMLVDELKGKKYSPSVEAMLKHLGYL